MSYSGYFDITDEQLSSFDVKEKVIVITGGSSGIGLATALLLAQHNATVIIADISPPPASDPALPDNITFIETDVTSWSSLCSLFKSVVSTHKHIDHVVANAGISPTARYLSLQTDESGDLIEPDGKCVDINLRGAINTATLGFHYLKQQENGKGKGSVVITASRASYYYNPGADYSVTKHGVIGYMRGILPLLHNLNPEIRVNCVCPSWTDTAILPPGFFAARGIAAQPASAVAKGIMMLIGDEKCNGWGLYVRDNRYKEVDHKLIVAAGELMGAAAPDAEGAWKVLGGRITAAKAQAEALAKAQAEKL